MELTLAAHSILEADEHAVEPDEQKVSHLLQQVLKRARRARVALGRVKERQTPVKVRLRQESERPGEGETGNTGEGPRFSRRRGTKNGTARMETMENQQDSVRGKGHTE